MGYLITDKQGLLIKGGLNTLFDENNIQSTKNRIENWRVTFSQTFRNAANQPGNRRHMRHHTLRFAAVVLHDILEVRGEPGEPIHGETGNLYRAWLKYLHWADKHHARKARALMAEIERALEPATPKPIIFDWTDAARPNQFDFTFRDIMVGPTAYLSISVVSSPSTGLPFDPEFDEDAP